MQELRILTGREVRQLITMRQAIDCIREAYVQVVRGTADVPLRTAITKKGGDTVLFMPAYLSKSSALGAKIVSVFSRNPRKGLPRLHAIVIMLNPNTGQPVAIMDGTYLTALRTGAASGIATELLSRRNSRSLAIIGAGVQGKTQLEAVCTVRKIHAVWVYDSKREAAERYVREMKDFGPPVPETIRVADSPAQAVREADVICTATTSFTPVFVDTDLKEGVHINSVGSFTPQMQEVPSRTVARAKIVVSSISAAFAEAGDLIIPLKEGLITESSIHGEIGNIISGTIRGRESEEEITFFKSTGLAVQDVAVGDFIRRTAEQKGIGTMVEL